MIRTLPVGSSAAWMPLTASREAGGGASRPRQRGASPIPAPRPTPRRVAVVDAPTHPLSRCRAVRCPDPASHVRRRRAWHDPAPPRAAAPPSTRAVAHRAALVAPDHQPAAGDRADQAVPALPADQQPRVPGPARAAGTSSSCPRTSRGCGRHGVLVDRLRPRCERTNNAVRIEALRTRTSGHRSDPHPIAMSSVIESTRPPMRPGP